MFVFSHHLNTLLLCSETEYLKWLTVVLFVHIWNICVSVSQAVNTVQQTILIVQEEEKKSYVFDFIRNMLPEDKVLIFVGKKLL